MQITYRVCLFFVEKWAKDVNRQFTEQKTHRAIKPMLLCSVSLQIREMQM